MSLFRRHGRPDPYYDKLGDRTSGRSEGRIQANRNKNYSYERIGLHVNTPKYGHENFADVHLMWNTRVVGKKNVHRYSMPEFVDAWYSGPLSSVGQIQVLRRSRFDVDEYMRYRSVSPDIDIDIDIGGYAMVIESGNFIGLEFAKRFTGQPVHIWLFGPMNFLNYSYGSLLITLRGNFKPGHGFQPFEIRGSPYAEGPDAFPIPRDGNDTAENMAAAYATRVDATFSVPLPPTARRWEWKIESYHRHLTANQLGNMRDGMPKGK